MIPALITEPMSPAEGALWYDIQSNQIKVYTQGGWTSFVDVDYEILNNKEW